MASDFGYIEYLCDQLQGAGTITYRKMFGEYALYCEGKVVGLVVGNSLFVKPAQATKPCTVTAQRRRLARPIPIPIPNRCLAPRLAHKRTLALAKSNTV